MIAETAMDSAQETGIDHILLIITVKQEIIYHSLKELLLRKE